MIFTHKFADLILAGEKTVTRRPKESKAGHVARRLEPGEMLPIQRGYAKACAHVRVVSCVEEFFWPDPKDHAEAHREGFADGYEFKSAWIKLYGSNAVVVWRIEFEPPTEETA